MFHHYIYFFFLQMLIGAIVTYCIVHCVLLQSTTITGSWFLLDLLSFELEAQLAVPSAITIIAKTQHDFIDQSDQLTQQRLIAMTLVLTAAVTTTIDAEKK